MSNINITKDQAKDFLLNYHDMLGESQLIGREGVVKYIKKVGCIQYDPLNVVGRNVDLVLQSKVLDYKPDMLGKLLYDYRELIDGWDKMMSIYDISDWHKMRRVREAHSNENINIMKNRGTSEALNHLSKVKNIIKEDGPKFSREVKLGGVNKGRWSSSKFANVALDHLFNLGELGVSIKKGTQKKYDLIDNILPDEILSNNDGFSSDAEFLKWYIKRRINSVGLLWGKNGGAWLGHFTSSKSIRLKVIDEMVSDGEVIPITIEGITDDFYIDAQNIDKLLHQYKYQPEFRFLAPLDNLLWDREMVRKLFNFEYSWEVYIPKEKRKYGYYVLPVLYGNQVVARFEPQKLDSTRELTITNWWWEDDIEITKEMREKAVCAFELFAVFLNAKIDKEKIRDTLL